MKDPAFLFYSKDWIEGTAEMMPEEKGIYIDLLCHQHQHGSIPSDTKRLCKIVRMSESDLIPLWDVVKAKWIANGDQNGERLVNTKLKGVMTDRADKGHKNKIIGVFASLLRKHDLTKVEYSKVRSLFKVDDFIPFPTEVATERLTEWFTNWFDQRSKSIVNGNAIEDVNTGTNTEIQSTGIAPEKTELQKAFDAYLEMRKKIKKPATDRAIELVKKKVNRLAPGNVQLAIDILNQSILNGWQDVYELKTEGTFIKGKNGKDGSESEQSKYLPID